jgi:mono/diheme cytochrome c family protein
MHLVERRGRTTPILPNVAGALINHNHSRPARRSGETQMATAKSTAVRTALAVTTIVGLLGTEGKDGAKGNTEIAGQPIEVSVTASTFSRHALHYHWRATDGHIEDVDARTTHWTLPGGPGIHFAYVLIEDGMGGFAESRIAVNTDQSASTLILPRDQYPPPLGETLATDPAKVVVPGTPLVSGTVLLNDFANEFGFPVAESHVCGTRNPFFGVTATATVEQVNAGGAIVASHILDANDPTEAAGNFSVSLAAGAVAIRASCKGTVGPGGTSAATALNDFSVTKDASGNLTATIPLFVPAEFPAVTAMSAILNGQEIGIFPSPPGASVELPSNRLPSPPEKFLAFGGLDTRSGACNYYVQIGAVEGCDASGDFTGRVLDFETWRMTSKIDEFGPPKDPNALTPYQKSAVFINRTDLNLTRDHHMAQAGSGRVAAYVCNHLGPQPGDDPADPTGLYPSQATVDKVIANARAGKSLVACVVMDRGANGFADPVIGVTGQPVLNPFNDTPYTRFMIFGPNGELLPSVNLDGRGEKFVPGACVACHGGRGYLDIKDAKNNPFAFPDARFFLHFGGDLGAYFLPFDVGNFAFASGDGKLEEPLFTLNEFVLGNVDGAIATTNSVNAGGSTDETAQGDYFWKLFAGWYPGPPAKRFFEFDTEYVSPTYGADSDRFYRDVIARSCRTCHLAMAGKNWDLQQPPFSDLFVCGDRADARLLSHAMPNSLVTSDRFWLSRKQSTVLVNGIPDTVPSVDPAPLDQPGIYARHYSQDHCTSPYLFESTIAAGDPTKGSTLFAANCASCHNNTPAGTTPSRAQVAHKTRGNILDAAHLPNNDGMLAAVSSVLGVANGLDDISAFLAVPLNTVP